MLANIKRIQRNRELNGERGFTLIELLIVIVVLGILAAIVVFALGGVTSQSAAAACNSDAKTVSIAVSAYEAQNPTVSSVPSSWSSVLVPTYLKSWPSSTAYTIAVQGTYSAPYVAVELASGDPAVTDGLSSSTYYPFEPGTALSSGGSPVTTSTSIISTAYTYSGSAFPTAWAGQGICAGA